MITNPESLAKCSATNFYSGLKAFEVRMFDNHAIAEAWLRQHSLAGKQV